MAQQDEATNTYIRCTCRASRGAYSAPAARAFTRALARTRTHALRVSPNTYMCWCSASGAASTSPRARGVCGAYRAMDRSAGTARYSTHAAAGREAWAACAACGRYG